MVRKKIVSQERHESADSFPLRPREKHGVVKAINKRCSKDLQAVVDGYCKSWVKDSSLVAILGVFVI
jgi:hypothetical protein